MSKMDLWYGAHPLDAAMLFHHNALLKEGGELSPHLTRAFGEPKAFLTTLHMVQEYLQELTLFTVVTNDSAGTGNDLLSITLLIDFAQTNPLT